MVKETPYVGPRPFQAEDRHRFFGRDREASELLSLSVAHRTVLLYAPSGAGKSSLLNALVRPSLEEEGFDVLPTARVRGAMLREMAVDEVDNVFIFYTLLSLAGDVGDVGEAEPGSARQLAGQSLSEFLETYPQREDDFGYPLPRVLIFDQFEELFTAYSQRWQDREQFFSQVRTALEKDRLLHLVFSMREDYIAQLDAYADMLPDHLRNRFRLERMQPRAALQAVRGPLAGTGRTYAPGVAEQLVEDLRKTRVESAGGQTAAVTGQFVEPVQLQVVCQNLWQDLPAGVETITSEHLRTFGNIDQALAAFYERAVRQAVKETEVSEAALRDWFEEQLLTPTGTRSTVHRGPEKTAGIANEAVETLENQHLLRGEWRAGARWYELTHDRLIDPIRSANRRWAEARRDRRMRTLLRAGGAVVFLLLIALLWSWRTGETATMEAGALEMATAEALSAATVRAEATGAALSATRESIAAATRGAATATSQARDAEATATRQANIAGATATTQAEFAEATAQVRATIDSQATATAVARATIDAYATATTIARATIDAQATASAVQSIAAGPVRPLRPGVSIGDTETQSAGTLSAFVEDEAGRPYMLVTWPFAREAGVPIIQPSPIDGGQLEAHQVATVTVPISVAAGSEAGPPATVAGSELVGLAGLEEGLSFLITPRQSVPLAGVGAPEEGMAVTVIGRTSGRVPAEITALNSSRTINSSGTPVTVAGVFLLDRLLAPGDQGALIVDDEGRLLGIGLGNSEQEAAVAVPIELVLERLNVELITLGQPIASLERGGRSLYSAAFNRAGDRIVTAGMDGVRLWDVEGNDLGAPTTGTVWTAVFHPDGQQILTAEADGRARIWGPGWELVSFFPHNGEVTSAVFSPDGTYVLTTSTARNVSLWNTRDLRLRQRYRHRQGVWAAVFNPAGDRIFAAGSEGVIHIWDLEGNELETIEAHEGPIWSIHVSPDGARIVSAGEDGFARLWDAASGELSAVLEGHEGPVRSAAFDPAGEFIVTASRDDTVRIWDLQGNQVGQIDGHSSSVYSAVYNPAANLILTASLDGSARVWRGK